MDIHLDTALLVSRGTRPQKRGKKVSLIGAIAEAGARLIYLPPYSPDFNPIEKLRTRVAKRLRHRELSVWSKVKNTLRSIGARTYQALGLALADAYSQVSLKDIRNWFAHSCYCISSSARNAIKPFISCLLPLASCLLPLASCLPKPFPI
jgi:transposase